MLWLYRYLTLYYITIFGSNKPIIIVPVFGGGPEPTYPESVSPRLTFSPGMFPTNQWCHSLCVGSARLGASGSEYNNKS